MSLQSVQNLGDFGYPYNPKSSPLQTEEFNLFCCLYGKWQLFLLPFFEIFCVLVYAYSDKE